MFRLKLDTNEHGKDTVWLETMKATNHNTPGSAF